MLPWFPVELNRNCDANETIVFRKKLSFLTNAVLKVGSEPGVDVTRNIYSGCSDEIVPVNMSISASLYAVWAVADYSYHELSLKPQCQKNVTMNRTTAKRCVILKNS
jgi:hypothetical protein